MTREECIKALQALWRYKDCEYSEHEVREALDMAIKNLDILEEIKAEIEKQEKWLLQAGYNQYNVDIAFSAIKSILAESEV